MRFLPCPRSTHKSLSGPSLVSGRRGGFRAFQSSEPCSFRWYLFPLWNGFSACGSSPRWQSFLFVTVGAHRGPDAVASIYQTPRSCTNNWHLHVSIVTFEVVQIHFCPKMLSGASTFCYSLGYQPCSRLPDVFCGDTEMKPFLSLLSLDSQCAGETCVHTSVWHSPLADAGVSSGFWTWVWLWNELKPIESQGWCVSGVTHFCHKEQARGGFRPQRQFLIVIHKTL